MHKWCEPEQAKKKKAVAANDGYVQSELGSQLASCSLPVLVLNACVPAIFVCGMTERTNAHALLSLVSSPGHVLIRQ